MDPRRLTVAAGALAAACLAQDPPTPAPGYRATELTRETGYAAGFAGFAPGRGPGALFYAVSHALYHRDAAGRVTLVHAFPVGARVDLLVRPPGSASLYYADDRSGLLRVHDVATGAESVRPLPHATFDLARTAAGDLLVAANPLWPAAAARPGVWLVDPAGGSAHREVVRLGPGASGPLLVEPSSGDLVCATASAQWPAPPGSTRLLRFAAPRLAAAVAGGPTLTEADAAVVATGLDAAFDLAVDDRGGFLVSNPHDGRVVVVRADGRVDPSPLFGPAAGVGALGLAFADGGAGTFDPFQPDGGAVLLVATNDWSTRAAVEAVRPARPRASSPTGGTAAPGILSVDLRGMPAGAAAFVWFNTLPLLPHEIAPVTVGGAPLWWSLDMQMPPLGAPVPVDPHGDARLDLGYPGGLSWTLAIQAVALRPGAPAQVVTSTPLTVTLRP